ncbi:1,4-alpha-glucan branching protein GlgB [Colwelliaceae bacterium 6471]
MNTKIKSSNQSALKQVSQYARDHSADFSALVNAQHAAPFNILGLQQDDASQYLVFTTFQAGADSVELIDKKTSKRIAKLSKVDEAGLFHQKLRRKNKFAYQLLVTHGEHSVTVEDPYGFSSTLGDIDIHLLKEGSHQKPYEKLGAHCCQQQNVAGVSFALWAPNASYVAVIGDFNHWDGRQHPLQNLNNSGYWNIFIPQVGPGSLYKFELKDIHGKQLPVKADPYCIQAQYRPDTASIVDAENDYRWQDKDWLAVRENRNARDAAISIYEVHLGSWRRDENNEFLNYRDIANQLIPYVLDMGFTHIQLMPVSEYPFDGSWGYQPIGLFAPTSRFGNSEDFQYFIDQCHQANLGVLIDWVPGHFPSDEHGLAQFDGSHLYEHADPRQGYHPDWNTLIYNYGRTEVANFLRASALHWLDRYHVDGVRVDAVASMLYLDYSRKAGEWIPNQHGGRENLDAVAFLQRFNEELYSLYPGTISVAEESTSWPGVSRPTSSGGLGFGYKWNMGWMNDSLRYMQHDPIHRSHHHNELSFSLVYAFNENFILPLSHDEVVHGKGSILARMPGDTWQQFANLRAYYGFMWSHPGKKLLFMGCEFAQGKEWDHDHELDWHQLNIHWHSGVKQWVKDLNHLYRHTPALYEKDCHADGFSWIDHDNASQSIFTFIRYGNDKSKPVVVICNFTPQHHDNFKIGVPEAGHYHEKLNSDAKIYGGSDQGNHGGATSIDSPWQNQPHHINIIVPPLSTVIFSLEE